MNGMSDKEQILVTKLLEEKCVSNRWHRFSQLMVVVNILLVMYIVIS